MFANSVAALMIASILTAQTPVPDLNAAPAAVPNVPASAAQNAAALAGQNPATSQTITLPAGTAIPVTLMSTIKSKSTKPGDSVRAIVAFPVTQGTQLAIPAGTYVEGVVNEVTAKPMSNQAPTFSVHFTRLVFTNGYSAPLSGENTQALLLPAETNTPQNEVAELLPVQLPGQHFAMGAGQTTPTLPPLPQVGPNPAVVGGIAAGALAAFGIGMLVWMHHRANSYDFAVFDVGWQFQMVLDSPVTLDTALVASAAAMTPPSVN
jgi:type IV secretion system protein VirB10